MSNVIETIDNEMPVTGHQALKEDPSKNDMASGHMTGSSLFLYMTISLSSVCWCCVRGTQSWLSSSKGIKNAWAGIFLRPCLPKGVGDEATLLLASLFFNWGYYSYFTL